MQLIVGLGNPGQKYARNRHNVGWMAIDRIALDHGFAPWRPRFQGLIAEGRLGDVRVTLLKPQTFMNLSGQSVGEAMRYLKLTPADVTVLHDELDLAPGKCRVKTGGGHAGHNGLRSMHQHIGDAYRRVRLGIGHPGRKELVTSHVLSDFAKADADWLEDLLTGVSDGAPALAAGDDARFAAAVSARTAPQGRGTDGREAQDGRPRAAPSASASVAAADPAPAGPAPAQSPSDMAGKLSALRALFGGKS
ncbi:aminoacyl-tRNA hydrolase [uncultured Paracoccus sp.]|uniref:aminoacyl-tRNA hydrolase n=1 Tax=uncultured Paracoccus sp. TaxID=189685 RepID=UPI00262534AD|nr:aminoacyl-tRNA hydrolase [uncultured Paracoccus sp.]